MRGYSGCGGLVVGVSNANGLMRECDKASWHDEIWMLSGRITPDDATGHHRLHNKQGEGVKRTTAAPSGGNPRGGGSQTTAKSNNPLAWLIPPRLMTHNKWELLKQYIINVDLLWDDRKVNSAGQMQHFFNDTSVCCNPTKQACTSGYIYTAQLMVLRDFVCSIFLVRMYAFYSTQDAGLYTWVQFWNVLINECNSW